MPTFSTPEPIVATVEFEAGEARITATDRTDTVVDVRPTDGTQEVDVRAAEQTRVEFADGRLRVMGPILRSAGLISRTGSIEVTIGLPAGSDLDASGGAAVFRVVGTLGTGAVRTGRGDVSLEEVGALTVTSSCGAIAVDRVGGDAVVSAGSGRIRLRELDGSALVKNSHGDIRIGTIRGELRAQTDKGDISVERAHTDVIAATACGDVRIEDVTRGRAALKTAYGRIEVGIRSGTAARLTARTVLGRVHNHLRSVDGPESTDETLELSANTSLGDIVIRQAESATV
ncbi:DUF4097 family beta strand repeat-containing protein [Rhodococcus kronopolitis]|uniref:DUF4097 domain-containing protein n=1 Tax=Rhodococcus kronopolitis TaxID=1460226 RepID=A0ABV9FM52_9NOCA